MIRAIEDLYAQARRGRGQVLVLFALFLTAFVGFAAVAIDVASVYSLQRLERSVADEAALAGAQDLQTTGSRANPTLAQQTQARTDALVRAASILGGTSDPSCYPNNQIKDCQIVGTPYQVSVTTPSPSVVNVTAERAVQVTVRQQDVPLTFARLFNQHDWNIAITSVAGLGFGGQYALVTLRPPDYVSAVDNNAPDINIDGGTVVDIQGDVGTNTNVVLSGVGSALNLLAGTDDHVDYFDNYRAWTSPPLGQQVPVPILDPGYPHPTAGSVAGAQDTTNCSSAIATAVAAGYFGHSSSNDPAQTYPLSTLNTTCYMPGNYNTDIGTSSNTAAVLLEPGVYFFNKGLSMGGTLIGGYQPGSYDPTTGQPLDHTGVVLVFPEANNGPQGQFSGNNATLVALNGGSCIAAANPATCKTIATPALDAASQPMQVLFSSAAGDVTAPETLIVWPPDPNCTVATSESNACKASSNQNNTLTLPGGGNLFVAGVQYAPTDNVKIAGGATGSGYVGQIVAWTVHYTGGSTVGEIWPGNIGNGVLRLDAACSGPNTPCTVP